MNPELIPQYDEATEALDGFATPETAEDTAAIETRLAREVSESERSWFPRWVLAPLGALRVFEALHRGMLTTLAEVRLELSWLDQQIALLQGERRGAQAEAFVRRRTGLLRHQAALAARLEGERERQVAAARDRIARLLEVALRFAAQEAAISARETLHETSACVQRVLGRIEGYDRLAREARSLAGGIELPSFLPEDVARVRSAASLCALRFEVAPKAEQRRSTAGQPSSHPFRAPAEDRAARMA